MSNRLSPLHEGTYEGETRLLLEKLRKEINEEILFPGDERDAVNKLFDSALSNLEGKS